MYLKQIGFWQDTFIGNIRQKLIELNKEKPDIFSGERQALIHYWLTFDGLQDVLGDNTSSFVTWWERATLPETLSRCIRSLKEEGIIKAQGNGGRNGS